MSKVNKEVNQSYKNKKLILNVPIGISLKPLELRHYLYFEVFKDVVYKLPFNILINKDSRIGLRPVTIDVLIFDTDVNYNSENWHVEYSLAIDVLNKISNV